MIYVLDSGPLIDLFKHYYPDRFPSLWEKFSELVATNKIVSVDEVYSEISDYGDRLAEWAEDNRDFFHTPSPKELEFVTEIFSIPHFQAMIRIKKRLEAKPVADPFVIAKARIIDGIVVTKEDFKPNAASIPNVCRHFGVKYMNLEAFMESEGWTF